MQKTKRIAAMLLVILSLIPVTPALAELPQISGYVYECGVGVEGVTINLYIGSTFIATTTSGAAGWFLFDSLAYDTPYTVTAETMVGTLSEMATLTCSCPTATIDFRYCPPCEPGLSPGYWKHQCKVWVLGRGHLHETELVALAASFGYTVEQAYEEFTTGNNRDGSKTDLANLFNAAAGYGVYLDE